MKSFALAAAAMTAIALAASLTPTPTAAEAEAPGIARGEYLARIMDCGGCHTTGALTGAPVDGHYLAGSTIGFELPGLGIFYPPNLTSDNETGLGTWTVEQIDTAIRSGVRPDGRVLAPIMAWPSYSALTEEDAMALATYIKSLPAVSHAAPKMVGPSEKPTSPYMTVKMPD